MKPGRLDWFKVYPVDVFEDDALDAAPLAVQGLLLRLWCVCARQGFIPDDPEEAARLARLRLSQVEPLWEQARAFFRRDTSGRRLFSRRIQAQAEAMEELRGKRREAGKQGAQKRHGSGGGIGLEEGVEGDPEAGGQDSLFSENINGKALANGLANGEQLPRDIRVREEIKNNPPTPHAPRGGRKRRGGLEVPELEEWVPNLARRLKASWHKADPDGRKITCSMPLLIQRLAAINARQPLYTEAVLEAAAEDYLRSERQRFKSPHHFFTETPDPHSDGKPPFKQWADSRIHLARLRAQTPGGENGKPNPETSRAEAGQALVRGEAAGPETVGAAAHP